jgi:hypothetical protein
MALGECSKKHSALKVGLLYSQNPLHDLYLVNNNELVYTKNLAITMRTCQGVMARWK